MKTFGIGVLVVVFASSLTALAQAPIKREAQTIRVAPAQTAQAARVAVDPVTLLQAQTRMMRSQIQELKRQIDFLVKDSQTAKANVPHCSADLRTSSSAQGSRDCAPYMCDSVVGTCMMSCATTNDCTPATACDIVLARCVPTQ